MDQKNNLFHHEKFFRLNNLLPVILLIITWGIYFWFGFENSLSTFVFVSVTFLVFVVASRRNSTYFIYNDRIELVNFLSKKSNETIRFDQIDQIRYEDSFDDSFGVFWSNFIIIYPKKGVIWKNQKKGRIALTVTGLKRQSTILKLLNFFQSKNLEVVIKTNSKKIKSKTGLQNWDQVR